MILKIWSLYGLFENVLQKGQPSAGKTILFFTIF
jgi:hypothetical protein